MQSVNRRNPSRQGKVSEATYVLGSRERWAEASFWLGLMMIAGAVLGGYTYGIGVAACVPLPFTLAVALTRSRWRIGLALAVWGAWFTGLGFVLA